jgi:hypothetical protein
VMAKPQGNAEDRKEPPLKKPPGYRNFERLLKQVVKAPPMRVRHPKE